MPSRPEKFGCSASRKTAVTLLELQNTVYENMEVQCALKGQQSEAKNESTKIRGFQPFYDLVTTWASSIVNKPVRTTGWEPLI